MPSDVDPQRLFDHGRFAPGTLLADRYRIVGLLGRGGMGEVYRADDLKIGQPVALKFLPEDVERDAVRLDRFVSEVRNARQISHPNVCRVYDMGEIDGPSAGPRLRRRFLSMEYIDGEDLRLLLRRIGRLPEDKGLQIARQICAGLAAMHDRGVVHRDLKPANVMLDGLGRVRLTDFGLATAVADAGTDGEIAGTPAYMAPEQLAGEPLSVQTDLYALGLVLFELFTGERVHKDGTPASLREAHRASPSATLSASSGAHLDPAVRRVIERCLDRDPRRRPASAIAVAAALPGGDPLAAALAAGETPSPQMVAASGDEGGLAPKVAVPCLVALVIGAVLTAWLNGREIYGTGLSAPNSPDVLAAKARDILTRLGETDAPADVAFGFLTDGDYRTWLDDHDKSLDRLAHLGSIRPAVVRFWYRSSPRSMLPGDYYGGSSGFRVSPTDPPVTVPGMIVLELDTLGRLVSLRRIPPERESAAGSGTATVTPNWAALFEGAGLDLAAFRPVSPEWLGHADADLRAAWLGPGATPAGAELRVEAAAYHGRPVFFRLVAPWTLPAEAATPPTLTNRIGAAIVLGVLIAVLTGAFALAIRHTRLGRADARGTARLALTSGVIVLTSGVITSHYVAEFNVVKIVFMIMSYAAFSGLMAWTFYTAVEPHIRRRWPRILISWSRLLEGRWRDPLVGRDLLLGSLLSTTVGLVAYAERPLLRWHGTPPVVPYLNADTLVGASSAAGLILDALPFSLLLSLGLLVLLVLLRIVLRSERAAAIGLLIVIGSVDVLGNSDPLVQSPLRLLFDAALVFTATRLGLVALFAMFFCSSLGPVFNLSLSVPDYLTGTMVLVLVAMLAPGVFGFYTSLAGRRVAARWLDE